jgi:hypothetical protein
MINECHPLLAAGAGQNALRLPDEAVVPYCDALGDRLSRLGAALEEEQKEGRLSIAAVQATRAFLHEIRATLLVMALKHGRQLLDSASRSARTTTAGRRTTSWSSAPLPQPEPQMNCGLRYKTR